MKYLRKNQTGFTLMEIVVATAIFATVVASILALFNYVLRINRQVQATRLVAQASRNFTEVLSREIRNGRIDYQASASCPNIDYSSVKNNSLAMISYTGERLCFYFDGNTNSLKLRRQASGSSTEETINPPNMTINPETFRFLVRPSKDPFTGKQGIQPMVTILAEFEVFKGTMNQKIVPYQSTISTDVYDLPNSND